MDDLFIMGGGINGMGIAMEAARRGLRVTLCDAQDFGGGTSSASSKLIHGGLRYLEQGHWRLVQESLAERSLLLQQAPHLVRPLTFILPCVPKIRANWIISLGLFCYDHLAKKHKLPSSGRIDLTHPPYVGILHPQFNKAFRYSDCKVDDARLVIHNALAAKQSKAQLFNYHEVIAVKPCSSYWEIVVKNHGKTRTFHAKILINATGPWMQETIQKFGLPTQQQLQLVKGSHLLLPSLYVGKHAYALQTKDKRMVFTIPFTDHFTLVGTTETPFQGDPRHTHIEDAEINYLLSILNEYFPQSVKPEQIYHAYAGVRPLLYQPHTHLKNVSRDYHLEVITQGVPPLLNVFGGKLTTHRALAQHALQQLAPYLPHFSNLKPLPFLPGGDIPQGDLAAYIQGLYAHFSELPPALLTRYFYDYGTRIYDLLKPVKQVADLGIHFGFGLYAREIQFLVEEEWAQTSADILWRRTQCGLFFTPETQAHFEEWCTKNL